MLVNAKRNTPNANAYLPRARQIALADNGGETVHDDVRRVQLRIRIDVGSDISPDGIDALRFHDLDVRVFGARIIPGTKSTTSRQRIPIPVAPWYAELWPPVISDEDIQSVRDG